MTKPVACVYARVTRNGVRKGKTRKGRPMVVFTASVLVEERQPTSGKGRPLSDPQDRRRKPWWLMCVVVNPQYLAQAEALAPGDYSTLMGRLERRRWKGDDAKWREDWTLFVDSMASFAPGRYPVPPTVAGADDAALNGGGDDPDPGPAPDPEDVPDPDDDADADTDADTDEEPEPGPLEP